MEPQLAGREKSLPASSSQQKIKKEFVNAKYSYKTALIYQSFENSKIKNNMFRFVLA